MTNFPYESLLDLDFFLADWVSSLYSNPQLSLYTTYEPGIEQLFLRTNEDDLTRALDFIISGIQEFEGDNPYKVQVSWQSSKDAVKIFLKSERDENTEPGHIFLTSDILNEWYESISDLVEPLKAGIIITMSQKHAPAFTLILPKIEPAGNEILELVRS